MENLGFQSLVPSTNPPASGLSPEKGRKARARGTPKTGRCDHTEPPTAGVHSKCSVLSLHEGHRRINTKRAARVFRALRCSCSKSRGPRIALRDEHFSESCVTDGEAQAEIEQTDDCTRAACTQALSSPLR